MCCYSENLPPLRDHAVRDLAGYMRQMELASGGYVCNGEDGTGGTDDDLIDGTLGPLRSRIVFVHAICARTLGYLHRRADSPGEPDPGFVLMELTEAQAERVRAFLREGA